MMSFMLHKDMKDDIFETLRPQRRLRRQNQGVKKGIRTLKNMPEKAARFKS